MAEGRPEKCDLLHEKREAHSYLLACAGVIGLAAS
jgi:hypothetical protein